ncbi:hypothetical protein DFJ63DRAFT_317197 [Scheffersomyces coipomensis]|uniref:uncharacterized protein n=1 Tax=Scheffersomyces coipomensis TaxID=1788519 RepID=UPI00315D9CF0
MKTLGENNTLTSSSSPASSMKEETMSLNTSTMGKPTKPKTPLKKEELEKIALELKKKLSRASITAKKSLSPSDPRDSSTSSNTSSSNSNHILSHNLPKSSPLKTYILRKQLASSPINNSTTTGFLSSSPNNLYSPNGKSPTHIRTPAAIYLSSSPLKNVSSHTVTNNEEDSPTKRRKHSHSNKSSPQMILEEISRPNTPSNQSRPYPAVLKPSLDLTSNEDSKSRQQNHQSSSHPSQTTPTLSKTELNTSNSTNILLQTPKQSRPGTGGNGNYNDDEGADLLMYLATSPSPAKPFYSANTPRTSALLQQHTQLQNGGTAPTSSPSSSVPSSANLLAVTGNNIRQTTTTTTINNASFIVPPPPATPKRHHNELGNTLANAKTPQNRLTPSMNLFNTVSANNNGLPSSGLTLTPNGFNMSDYVNFFTPSPGSANLGAVSAGGVPSGSNLTKNLLKTPDFNNLLSGSTPHILVDGRSRVDGKLLNFNKVLFNNNAASPSSATSSAPISNGLHSDGSNKD